MKNKKQVKRQNYAYKGFVVKGASLNTVIIGHFLYHFMNISVQSCEV